MWNGKRTARVELPRIPRIPRQLRIDPEMGKRIRARAALNRRTIQQELLHLLEESLKAESV
jgi:hypothetical protein